MMLWCNDEQTDLMTGDIIIGNKFSDFVSFYRNGEVMKFGSKKVQKEQIQFRNDQKIDFEELICYIAFMHGFSLSFQTDPGIHRNLNNNFIYGEVGEKI